VIRNVILVKLKDEYDAAELARIKDGLYALGLPGTLSYVIGDDLALRDGNWSFAIVADFADLDAYRGYDLDEPHNALRARLAPLTEQVARVQFEL
jgi:hypothetical protein